MRLKNQTNPMPLARATSRGMAVARRKTGCIGRTGVWSGSNKSKTRAWKCNPSAEKPEAERGERRSVLEKRSNTERIMVSRRGNNDIQCNKLLMQRYARTPSRALSHYEVTITFDANRDGVILFFEHPIGCVATNQKRVSVWAAGFGVKRGRRVLRRDWIGGPGWRLVDRSQKGGRWIGVYPVVEGDFS